MATNTKKTSNSPSGIYEYRFITFNREVIGIRRKTTKNYLSFVYNTELCIFIFNNNSSLWNLSNFSQHGSKSENQGDFEFSIEDITLTYKLISLKQPDNLSGKYQIFYLTKSLTTIRQSTSVWILSPELPAKVANSEMHKSFRKINELTTFSGCVNPPAIPLNTQNRFDLSCWSPDKIRRLFLHSCTSVGTGGSWVIFFGHLSSFLKLSLALPHGIVRYCFISFL